MLTCSAFTRKCMSDACSCSPLITSWTRMLSHTTQVHSPATRAGSCTGTGKRGTARGKLGCLQQLSTETPPRRPGAPQAVPAGHQLQVGHTDVHVVFTFTDKVRNCRCHLLKIIDSGPMPAPSLMSSCLNNACVCLDLGTRRCRTQLSCVTHSEHDTYPRRSSKISTQSLHLRGGHPSTKNRGTFTATPHGPMLRSACWQEQ